MPGKKVSACNAGIMFTDITKGNMPEKGVSNADILFTDITKGNMSYKKG